MGGKFTALMNSFFACAIIFSVMKAAGAKTFYPTQVSTETLANAPMQNISSLNEIACALVANGRPSSHLCCFEEGLCSLYELQVPAFQVVEASVQMRFCATDVRGNLSSNAYTATTSQESATATTAAAVAVAVPTTTTTTTIAPGTTTTITTTLTTAAAMTTTTVPTPTIATTITTSLSPTSTPTPTPPPTTTTTPTTTIPTTITTATPLVVSERNCSQNFKEIAIGCIHTGISFLTFNDSLAKCESLNSQLVVTTETGFNYLQDYLLSLKNYTMEFWIGIRNGSWLSGRLVRAEEWADGEEPNQEFCGLMAFDNSSNSSFRVKSTDCTYESQFICEEIN